MPALAADVHDLEGLRRIGDLLAATDPISPTAEPG